MSKRIFILNGMARSGKDTFASFLGEFVPVFKYSSIDRVKFIASMCGWRGGKTEKDRKFLSDLKRLTTDYSEMSFLDVKSNVESFLVGNIPGEVMLIDIREPEEIEKAKMAFNATTILITNPNVQQISSNKSDARVYEYKYDYIITNSGTLDDLRESAKWFANDIILSRKGED